MTNLILKTSLLVLLAAALAGMPAQAQVQTSPTNATSSAAPAKKAAAETAGRKLPFHGKLAAVDKNAKTITVGKRTFQITSETKIFKDAKPATLDEAVVGEQASGSCQTEADGKLVALKVTLGAKVQAKTSEKKADAAEKTSQP